MPRVDIRPADAASGGADDHPGENDRRHLPRRCS